MAQQRQGSGGAACHSRNQDQDLGIDADCDLDGRDKMDNHDTMLRRTQFGVLAQEVAQVIPDAVVRTSDIQLANGETVPRLMVVDKERLFMESIGAIKHLASIASNLQAQVTDLRQQLHDVQLQTQQPLQ
eukprot:m.99102 g.99102  ORF g.99102 m.99102 type:complete len:130 (+) comp13136_c0_seq1:717-1106(+)